MKDKNLVILMMIEENVEDIEVTDMIDTDTPDVEVILLVLVLALALVLVLTLIHVLIVAVVALARVPLLIVAILALIPAMNAALAHVLAHAHHQDMTQKNLLNSKSQIIA